MNFKGVTLLIIARLKWPECGWEVDMLKTKHAPAANMCYLYPFPDVWDDDVISL